jgi:hypothetical protein
MPTAGEVTMPTAGEVTMPTAGEVAMPTARAVRMPAGAGHDASRHGGRCGKRYPAATAAQRGSLHQASDWLALAPTCAEL